MNQNIKFQKLSKVFSNSSHLDSIFCQCECTSQLGLIFIFVIFNEFFDEILNFNIFTCWKNAHKVQSNDSCLEKNPHHSSFHLKYAQKAILWTDVSYFGLKLYRNIKIHRNGDSFKVIHGAFWSRNLNFFVIFTKFQK